MKKPLTLLIILCAIFLFTTSIYSQWQWSNPVPQGNDLWNVSFGSTTTAWAVGGAGSIIHTGDGGANWNEQESGTNDFLLRGINIQVLEIKVIAMHGITSVLYTAVEPQLN